MCNLIRKKLSARTHIINTVLQYSIHNADEEKSLENEVESTTTTVINY